MVDGNGHTMKTYLEGIRELVQEANRRGFRAKEIYLDMEVQGGWCVNGIADFKKDGGHTSWSQTGWVFDNKADATNFYNEFKKK